MFTLRDLDELAGFAVMNIRTLNSTVLRAIGEKVRLLRKGGKFDKFESQSRFSSDADKLLREIQKEIDIATASIEEVYARVAKIAYRSYAESFLAQGLKQPPIEQERALVNFIQSVAATTKGSFANLSNTTAIGFRLLDPGSRTTFVGFKRHYHNLIDQAVADIATGNESWSGAFRNALKQTADSGIRVLDYESGYSRRLDSAMRQNVLDGVKAITTEITARNGGKFGADGWEIDAHNWCAPDHLPFQGRRFTKAEFEEIQEMLPRKFETWNCRHTVYAVDLKASTPLYTEDELKEIAATSTEVREFDGREYTAYEATQLQRKLETQIRKHKDRANIAKAAGDDLTRRAEQLRINQLKDKYVELSNRFGLPVAKDRMAVAGFRKVKADSVVINSKQVLSTGAVFQVDHDLVAAAKLAEDAMINVHGRGTLPSIPLVKNNRIKSDGEFRYHGISGKVVGIHINITHKNPELAILHEYGHYIDLKAFSGVGGDFATSLRNPILDNWFDTINKSKSVVALHKEFSRASASNEIRKYIKYLLNPKELFARSYSQYIASKSGDKTLLTQLNNERASSLFKTLWDDDDFVEIMREFDIIMAGLKWIKK